MALLINDINLDRQDLAAFLPDLRSIKAFENLAKAVSATIPDAVNGNTDSIDDLAAQTVAAAAQALVAIADAAVALALAQQADANALQSHVLALISEVAELRKQINDMTQGTLL